MLRELIAAALLRNGQQLGQVMLNVANVVVEPEAAGELPAGEFVAVTVRSAGDWSPETTWTPAAGRPLVNADVTRAAAVAGAVYGYTRTLAGGEGSATVFVAREA